MQDVRFWMQDFFISGYTLLLVSAVSEGFSIINFQLSIKIPHALSVKTHAPVPYLYCNPDYLQTGNQA